MKKGQNLNRTKDKYDWYNDGLEGVGGLFEGEVPLPDIAV